MEILQAIILGIVQGVTEFLPISSTAHLRVIPALLGWKDPGAPFTAVIQIGTLLSVLIYFRKDIATITAALFRSVRHKRPFETQESREGWYILFGTIPIIVFGFLLKDMIETSFRSLYVISGSLIGLAILLWIAEKRAKHDRDFNTLSLWETQIIGIAQAVALIPGSSRSGTTITAGLFLNLTREAAARFSFLLSIPAIGLSGLYQLYKLRDQLNGDYGLELAIATVVSGVVGYLAIDVLLKFLRTHTTGVFIVYRIALGIAILALLYFGVVPA